MLDTDIAWAAGFLDGDGCLRIQVGGRGHGIAVISATQIDVTPLNKLKELFGGNIRIGTHNKNATIFYWDWRLYGTKALLAIDLLRPYLLVKDKQADVLIELGKIMKGPGGKNLARLMTPIDIGKRQILKAAMDLLNYRERVS